MTMTLAPLQQILARFFSREKAGNTTMDTTTTLDTPTVPVDPRPAAEFERRRRALRVHLAEQRVERQRVATSWSPIEAEQRALTARIAMMDVEIAHTTAALVALDEQAAQAETATPAEVERWREALARAERDLAGHEQQRAGVVAALAAGADAGPASEQITGIDYQIAAAGQVIDGLRRRVGLAEAAARTRDLTSPSHVAELRARESQIGAEVADVLQLLAQPAVVGDATATRALNERLGALAMRRQEVDAELAAILAIEQRGAATAHDGAARAALAAVDAAHVAAVEALSAVGAPLTALRDRLSVALQAVRSAQAARGSGGPPWVHFDYHLLGAVTERVAEMERLTASLSGATLAASFDLHVARDEAAQR